MKKNNVLEFAGRDTIYDPLTDLLRSGAQQLINQAVEAELQELLSQHSGRRTEWPRRCGSQWSFTGTRTADRIGTGDGQDSKGSLKDRGTRDVPISPCSALCPQDEVSGGGIAMAVSEGHIKWRDE